MTARRGAATLAAVLLALHAAPSDAQVPRRGGLWVDAGAGYGRLRLTCATCSQVAAASGTEVTVTVGGAPSSNVLLGLQAQTWSNSRARQKVRSLVAVVQWYPWPARGWFVRAGTGIVQGPVTPRTDSTSSTTAQGTGVGLDFGMGYDLPVSEHFGLTLQASSHIAALGDLEVAGQPANDVIAYIGRLGIAVVVR